MPKRKLLWEAVATQVVAGGFVLWWMNALPNVPDPSQVVAMQAVLYDSPGLPDNFMFEVPAESFAPILTSLRPYGVDGRPAKWQVLGELHMKCGRVHRSRVIHLYRTTQAQGAFSVETFDGRVYNRGGTDTGIEDALRAAYHP